MNVLNGEVKYKIKAGIRCNNLFVVNEMNYKWFLYKII